MFDRIPVYYQHTAVYLDPETGHNFKYSTPISSGNNPQNVIAIDLDNDEHYELTPKLVLPATPTLFEPKEVQSAISPNTFTAQDLKCIPLLN